jgi:hypothetical protein
MGFGLVGDKMGNLGIWVASGGWVRWRKAGGGVSVVGEVDAGGGWRWVCVFWMFGEVRDGGEGRGLYGWLGKMGERGGKRDLKQVTQDLKPSTFERT